MERYIILIAVMFSSLISNANPAGIDLEPVYDLRGKWKFNIGDDEQWASPSFNDKDWSNIFAPGAWENEGFYGYDGYAWYRITVPGSELDFDHNLYLMLGYIDDVDEVYINGKLVGRSGRFPPRYSTAFNARRLYFVPHDVINRNGSNTIAVRVFDEGKEGGIIRGRIGFYEDTEDLGPLVNLQGMWKFKPGNNLEWKNKYWNDESWEDIITPSYWRNAGWWKLDGKAWYRKTFFLDKRYKNEELYVVLGKIDDFDRTYINGEFIGETNDHRGYGRSESYLRLRMYKLPKESLLFNGYNTIAIQVTDIGNNGGLYEGPVGIVSLRQMKKIEANSDSHW